GKAAPRAGSRADEVRAAEGATGGRTQAHRGAGHRRFPAHRCAGHQFSAVGVERHRGHREARPEHEHEGRRDRQLEKRIAGHPRRKVIVRCRRAPLISTLVSNRRFAYRSRMTTRSVTNGFFMRLIGAISLDAAIYEEIEADRGATGQALAVVLLSSL